MGILGGNPKEEPLHYGEVFHLWTFAGAAKAAVSFYQVYANHAGDGDLKKLIQECIASMREEIAEVDKILTANGIMPAPEYPERPQVDWAEIPAGARLSDLEIAGAVAMDISLGMAGISTMMGMSIREDLGAKLAKFHASKTMLAARALELNKKKGWLVPPPLHIRQPETVHA